MKKLALALVAALSAACNSDGLAGLDFQQLDRLPGIDSLNISAVHPDAAHDYWELRHAFPPSSRVVGSGGPKTRDQLPQSIRATLDTLHSMNGFHPACLPAYCYNYAVVVNGTAVTPITTFTAFQKFLGRIESREEAALIVHALGYYWGADRTGIRDREDGWDVVALQLVKDCAPVQSDQVLIRITRSGNYTEVDRKVYSKQENACI